MFIRTCLCPWTTNDILLKLLIKQLNCINKEGIVFHSVHDYKTTKYKISQRNIPIYS